MDKIVLKNNEDLVLGHNRLPAEYQEVEYLSTYNNNRAFIRTTLNPTSSLDTEIKFAVFKQSEKTDQKVFGVSFVYGLALMRGHARIVGSQWISYDQAPIYDGVINIYKTDGITSYFNDFLIENNYRQESSQYITLFALANQTGTELDSASGYLHIYYAKFFNNGVQCAEFVPCYRKSDNVAGMYDLCGSICPLTGTPFYINAGGGSFEVGPDILVLISPLSAQSVKSLLISNCPNIDGLKVLRKIYDESSNQIVHIYLAWDGTRNGDNKTMEVIDAIARNKLKDGTTRTYQGMNIDGTDNTSNPIINGTLQVATGFYYDLLDALNVTNTEQVTVSGVSMTKITTSNFGTLYIVYNPNLAWIRFEDPEVERICVAKWGVGGGVSHNTLAAINSSTFGTTFYNNTVIETFNEFKYFTGVKTSLAANSFRSCTHLREITFGEQFKGNMGQNGCFNSALSVVNIPSKSWWFNESAIPDSMGTHVLYGTTAQDRGLYINGERWTDLDLSDEEIGTHITAIRLEFYNLTNITHINIPQHITSIASSAFSGLKTESGVEFSLNLPNITSIGSNAFNEVTALTEIIDLGNLTTLSAGVFGGCTNVRKMSIPTSVQKINPNGVGYGTLGDFGSNVAAADREYYDIVLPNLVSDAFGTATGNNRVFTSNQLIKRVLNLGSVQIIPNQCFLFCNSITYMVLPPTVTHIGGQTIQGRVAVIRAVTPPTLATYNEPIAVYVPEDSIEAYKAASGWSAYASKIKGYISVETYDDIPQSGSGQKYYYTEDDYELYEFDGLTLTKLS